MRISIIIIIIIILSSAIVAGTRSSRDLEWSDRHHYHYHYYYFMLSAFRVCRIKLAASKQKEP